jgi:[ribosomal protein S5]-alanine N-acetyltransferase
MLTMSSFLTSRRLSFRIMTPGDIDFVAELVGDPQVMRFYPRVLDRQGARDWLNRVLDRQQRDGFSWWLVANKTTMEPLGQCGLLKQEADGVTENEIGYMFHQRHWRHGYASEAAAAVRDHAFQALGKHRVISLIRPANVPSQRVALSYGAKPERLIVWRDFEHLVFGLNREDA